MVMQPLEVVSYTTEYGTYTFGAFCSSRLAINPLPSKDGRGNKGVEYTLHVDDYVVSPNGTDSIADEMDDWEKILTTRCGRLRYQNRGHDLDVNNPAGTVRDIGGRDGLGPIPKLSEFRTMGGQAAFAAKVSWSCTTTIPKCAANTVYQGRPMDLGFEVTWRIDDGGVSTRVISGWVEIPVFRLYGIRVGSDQADAYRPKVIDGFPMLPGFTRNTNWKLSADRKTDTFTIVDAERDPNYFQVGMERWRGTHETHSAFAYPFGFVTYGNTISASFTVQRDKHKSLAWKRFGALVASRIAPRKPLVGVDLFRAVKTAVGERTVIPQDLRVTDSLDSKEVNFTFSYTHISSPHTFLADAGMWEPIPNADWDAWKKEARNGAANERGYMQLGWKREWDAWLDLCSDKKAPIVPPDAAAERAGPVKIEGAKIARFKPPKPEESFMAYEAHLRFVGTASIARHKPLHYAPAGLATVHEHDVNSKTHLQQGSAPSDVLQSVGSPTCDVILTGSAVRAGYAVVPPKLISVGGVAAQLIHEDIRNAEIGNGGGIPIFGGRWRCVYMLPATPTGNIPVPKNPLSAEETGAGVERV